MFTASFQCYCGIISFIFVPRYYSQYPTVCFSIIFFMFVSLSLCVSQAVLVSLKQCLLQYYNQFITRILTFWFPPIYQLLYSYVYVCFKLLMFGSSNSQFYVVFNSSMSLSLCFCLQQTISVMFLFSPSSLCQIFTFCSLLAILGFALTL